MTFSIHLVTLLLLTVLYMYCTCRRLVLPKVSKALHLVFFTASILSVITLWLCSILFPIDYDVETNPVPNSISVFNFTITKKCFLLKAYISVCKFKFIYDLEIYLDSSTRPDDFSLEIALYNM